MLRSPVLTMTWQNGAGGTGRNGKCGHALVLVSKGLVAAAVVLDVGEKFAARELVVEVAFQLQCGAAAVLQRLVLPLKV